MSRRKQTIDVQSSPIVAPERNVTGTLQARLASRKSVTTSDVGYTSPLVASPKVLPALSLAGTMSLDSPPSAPVVEGRSRGKKRVLKKKPKKTAKVDPALNTQGSPRVRPESTQVDSFVLEGNNDRRSVRSGSIVIPSSNCNNNINNDDQSDSENERGSSKSRKKKDNVIQVVQYPFVMANNTREVCAPPDPIERMLCSGVVSSDEKAKPVAITLSLVNHVQILKTKNSAGTVEQQKFCVIHTRVVVDGLKFTITHQTGKQFCVIVVKNDEDRTLLEQSLLQHIHFINPSDTVVIPAAVQRTIVMPLAQEPGTQPTGVSQETDTSSVDHLPKPGFFSRVVGALLRKRVSKKKRRFVTADMDLDLTYITPQVIAMGYPAEGKEALIRNPMEDVQRFLRSRHCAHKVYNQCSEREYDSSCFDHFLHFPFNDHFPCSQTDLFFVLDDMVRYFKDHPKGTVSVHCKAGKGRTGTIICAFLLYTGCFTSAVDSLRYYAQNRTHNGEGITIPSQARLVYQLEKILKSSTSVSLTPTPAPIFLGQLTMCSGPQIDEIAVTCNGLTHSFQVAELARKGYVTEHKHSHNHTHLCHISDEHDTSECLKPRLPLETMTFPGIGDPLSVECPHKFETAYVFPRACMGSRVMDIQESTQIIKNAQNFLDFGLQVNGIELQGDFLVQCLFKKKVVAMTSLNTQFIPSEQYRVKLSKENTDVANKKKKLEDFSLELFFFAK